MGNLDEVRDFLTSRRDRLTPGQAGVPLYSGRRRVKGLRREEVAMLAGMSTDCNTRPERGNLSGVSGRDGRARERSLVSRFGLCGPACRCHSMLSAARRRT